MPSAVNKRQIRLLSDYLVGEHPTHTNERGEREWHMNCPLHHDAKRSASLNVDNGMWFCQAGCGGGSVVDLIKMRANWVSPDAETVASNGHHGTATPKETITEGKIAGWHSALLASHTNMEYLIDRRALTTDTIKKYEIGWDRERKVYTIPVRGPEREIWNIRRYDPNPSDQRRKIWGVEGMGVPRLYPINVFSEKPPYLIVGEGEWDILVLLSHGYWGITRTGAAGVWDAGWGENFKDMLVYVCHDRDDAGQKGDLKVARALRRIAADVRQIELPYALKDKHGADITDFFLEHDSEEFQALLDNAKPVFKTKTSNQPETVTVLESFDARKVGDPARLLVTIKGRREPGYSVPKTVRMGCTRDRGPACKVCPLNASGGEATISIDPDDPLVLGLLDAAKSNVEQQLAESYGVPSGRCNRLQMDVEEYQAVEILFARPALDYADGSDAGAYKTVKLTSVGRHDTLQNTTVAATGALQPNPRSQQNEFLTWEVERLETSLETFELTPDVLRMLKRFQAGRSRPLKKLADINRALARNVTHIHGRPEMHVLMDLTWHSVLRWRFAGEVVERGTLESLILGDTRTGKSIAAKRLRDHYGAGEIINCEGATFAGVVGGVQQLNGNAWVVTWGVIPMNDQRLVVLDEVGGLTTDEIAQMSDVRSSGIAKLTKVEQDATPARTRLLWMGNPREAKMSNFTYGVDAIAPLIGNAEDIARFDLAMAVTMYDVPAEDINRRYEDEDMPYTGEACNALLMWAWSRKEDQVEWGPGAEERIFELANEMGNRYVEDPPLVQAANVRIKIARVAVALAARLFSTDASCQKVVVRKEHVEDAVAFVDRLYNMVVFGYAERSRERLGDRREAEEKREETKQYLLGRPSLAKYLRSTGKFRRQDLEEILNMSREEANATINTLWEARMVWKDKGDVRVEPTLHALLREVKL